MGHTTTDAGFLAEAHKQAMEGNVEQMSIFYKAVQAWAGGMYGMHRDKAPELFEHSTLQEEDGPQLINAELVVDLQDDVF